MSGGHCRQCGDHIAYCLCDEVPQPPSLYDEIAGWIADEKRKPAALAFTAGPSRNVATIIEDAGLLNPASLSWKPGPPPLDRPGARFDCLWPLGARRLVELGRSGRAFKDDGRELYSDSFARIVMHCPLPDPPAVSPERASECRAASEGATPP